MDVRELVGTLVAMFASGYQPQLAQFLSGDGFVTSFPEAQARVKGCGRLPDLATC